MTKIFVSYRRSDTASDAGRIREHLAVRFGSSEVFQDITNVRSGVKFMKLVEEEIRQCKVVLVLIGDRWIEDGKFSKFVREEIEFALANPDADIIPVTTGKVELGDHLDLPESIRSLADNSAIHIEAGVHYNSSMASLIKDIEHKLKLEHVPDYLQQKQREHVRKVKIPPLLPYKANRIEQRNQLVGAMGQHRNAKTMRPMMIFVWGDENQAPNHFVDELRTDDSAPKLLRIEQNSKVETRNLVWPRRAAKLSKRFDALYQELCNSMFDQSVQTNQTVEEVAQALLNYHCPFLLTTEISSSHWHNQEPQLIEEWINFWSNWPSTHTSQPLVIIVKIVFYKSPKKTLFARFKQTRIEKKIRQYLSSLEDKHVDGLSLEVLPELESVLREDVVTWVQGEGGEFIEARANELNIQDRITLERVLRPEIDHYFQTTEDGRHPMLETGDWLSSQLEKVL